MRRRSPERLVSIGLVLAGVLASFGCGHLPTTAERKASFTAHSAHAINGVGISHFAYDRCYYLLRGAMEADESGDSNSQRFTFEQGLGIGVAAAIDPRGYFITAAHVLGDEPMVLISMSNPAKAAPFRVVWKGDLKKNDLAILRVNGPVPATFDWGSVPKPGDPAMVPGVNLGDLPNIGAIMVSGVFEDSDPPAGVIYHTTPLRPGDSGSPVFNDRGEIVGINSRVNGSIKMGERLIHVPFFKRNCSAVRPDLDWLNATIERDFLEHPGRAAGTEE